MREVPSRVPFHPLLFAVAAPISLLASNIDQIRPGAAARASIVSLVAGVIIYAVVRIIGGDWRRAALITSMLIVLFSTYGLAYIYLRESGEFGWTLARHRYMASLWLSLAAASIFAFSRLRVNGRVLTSAFNLAGAVAVLIPIAQMIAYGARSGFANLETGEAGTSAAKLSLPAGRSAPDIYYIITDAYSRDDYLLASYGFDNQQFLEALEDMGFYVARCSRSNYAQTNLSLPSSLNMEYLELLDDSYRPGNTEKIGLDHLIRQSRVRRELEALGYSVVAFETGFFYTQLEDADYYYELPKEGTLSEFFDFRGINGFEAMWLQNSGVKFLLDSATATGVLALLLPDLDRPRSIYRDRALFVLGQLEKENVPAIRGPKFVFAHIVSPHYPYVIDREGEFVNREIPAHDKDAYIDQLVYLNTRLVGILRGIVETAEVPPIVILQADHGNFGTPGERTSILNAYFLPGDGANGLYQGISPVNTFRLIFDTYFEGEFGLLEDRSFLSGDDLPFDYQEIFASRPGCKVTP